MPTYLTPGVYIEEIPSGVRPVEGVATSVAAFVGPARRGPAGEAQLIHGLGDYETTYGKIHSENDFMGLAVTAFYQNGGKDAYIARLVSDNPPAVASFLTVKGQNTGDNAVLKISATSVGKWGDKVQVRIKKPNAEDLSFTLEVGHLENEVFVADEPQYTDLNMNAASPDYVLTRLNGVSALVTTALEPAADPEDVANTYQKGSLTGAQLGSGAGVFNSGVHDKMTLTLNIDGLGAKRITLGTKASLNLAGDNAGDGAKLAEAVRVAVVALGASQTPYKDFGCEYKDRKFTLTSGRLSSSSSVIVYGGDGSNTDLAKLMKIDPASNPVLVHGSANVVPQALMGPLGEGVPLENGEEGEPKAADYQSFFDNKLVKVRDASIVILPGQSIPSNGAGNLAVDAAITHCEATGSRMAIIDAERGCELEDANAIDQLALTNSTYAVLYYPWVMTRNPFYNRDTNPTASPTLTIAPSALAAGMRSRIDGKRGIWKAPAGVETDLRGVAGLEFDVGDGEQRQLNPAGVNVLRKLPGGGGAYVIWGSRTRSTRADPQWRYVPVRRTAIFIERSIYNGIQWAVFEPNDHRLWASLRLNVESFMDGLFRTGAFQGAKASDAYFVRCGLGDTMTQGDIDRGQVIMIVGFAPLKPAEFVIVRIQQMVGQQ